MDINHLPLIPRKLLFDNPERTQARLSPSGAYLSWLAPKAGVLNVWVARHEDLHTAQGHQGVMYNVTHSLSSERRSRMR